MSDRIEESQRDRGGTKPPEGRQPAARRRWGRWVAFGLLLTLAAAGAFVAAVELGWQRQRILSMAIALAEQRLGLEISAKATPGRLSRGMELREIRIGEPGHPVAEIDSLHIRWNAFAFLSSERWITESIEIDGWSLRLHSTADGEWIVVDDLLARLAEPDPTKTSPPDESVSDLGLLIRQIKLGSGNLFLTLDRRVAPSDPTGDVGAGPLRAQIEAEGELRRLQISPEEPLEIGEATLRARLVESDSGIPELDRALQLRAEARFVGRDVGTLTAQLNAPGLAASADLAGNFDRLERAVFELEAEDLAPLSGWLQVEQRVTGRVSARAELSGPPSLLTGDLKVEARDLVFEDLHARELDIDLDLADPISVAFEDPSALDARVRLRARGFDLLELDREWFPAGEADLDLVGELAAGRLDLERAQVRMKGLALDAKGSLTRKTINRLDIQLDVDDVAPWLRIHAGDLPIRGELHARARLEGPVAKPTGEIALNSKALYFADRSVGPMTANLKRGRTGPAAIELAFGEAADSPLHAKAEIDLDREIVDVTAVAEVEAWARLFEDAPSIRGHVNAQARLERTTAGPRFAVTLHSADTFFDELALGSIVLEARSESDETIDLSTFEVDGPTGFLVLEEPTSIRVGPEGRWQTSDLHLRVAATRDASDSGTIELRAAGASADLDSLDSTFEGLPVAWANQFFPDQPEFAGRLAGFARWHRIRGPDWTLGELEWGEPQIGTFRLDQVAMRWKGEPSSIGFDIETSIAGRSPLTAHGNMALPDHEIGLAEILSQDDLTLQLDLDDWDLATLDALSPSWVRRIAGKVSGSIQIEHDTAGVHLSGGARIADGSFTIPLLRQRFSPVEAEVRLSNHHVMIDFLRVGKPDAQAEFAGSLDYSSSESPVLDASLRFEHFPIARSSAAWMDLQGEVLFSGSVARPVARGSLAVEDAKIGVAASDDPILKEIRIATRTSGGSLQEPTEEKTPPLHSAKVDISIQIPGSTRVRGQGANLFVEGEATLTKRPFESPRIHGEARVVNGSYTFQGRRFDVRRGRLLLTGDESFDPVVDVEARLPVADIIAIVRISGRLSSPIIRLSSEPSRSDPDVLSYLLFGRPADEVAGAGSARFDAAAARLFAGVAEQEMREVLGDAMPIDSIEIGADAEGATSEIGFGKYIGRNLYFRYVHILGDEPAERVGVEYRLNDQFSIGSSVTTTGDAGLDLILRHDF